MRPVSQRVNAKKTHESNTEFGKSTSELIILKPEGYPLSGMMEEYPVIENRDVFEFYAREQWNGYVARKGDYLFDRRMFPDFAYRIIDVEPAESIIGNSTSIIVTEEENGISSSEEIKGDVRFEDVIGQELAKQKCRLIERFLEEPERFGKWAPRNILFFGPSGTGKTMLAKALANKTDVPIIPVKATQLIGEYVGDGARQIHQLYDKAEEMSPCIIFIDELDAIALDRRFQELRGDVSEIVNALLTEMDGIVERDGVCTICSTNRINSLDSAVRSRFEEEIEFVLPGEEEIVHILRSNVKTFPLQVEECDFEALAKKAKGLSGRDIVEKILKTALHQAIIEDRETVAVKDFEKALAKLGRKDFTPDPTHLYV
ncbi:AAA family ATPase [Methanosarcina sp.]|uniref:AAA family ATPase n=1 Tax=Methanosarcina sp. TaxID=2213 RepID=UPI002AB906D2|nr:AAA family ATPase [Methanosarcina sp.]MDY9927940.1 AAA family ATPase [Methanosarcina sp.]